MALPMNDDFANCELSTEELEAIAAGHWWNTLAHYISDIGWGVAIFGSIFGGVQAAAGVARNGNVTNMQ